ncbi:hypothetical protein PV325_001435 [Microctonus aethiopoides]|nr:hypothetical protein PV325_001435 [Microctonus aethiopoides]
MNIKDVKGIGKLQFRTYEVQLRYSIPSHGAQHSGKHSDPSSNQNAIEDSASRSGPYFDISASKNVTALLGKTTYLNCRVKNLGNKTQTNGQEEKTSVRDKIRDKKNDSEASEIFMISSRINVKDSRDSVTVDVEINEKEKTASESKIVIVVRNQAKVSI